tara:strand:+ start:97 stop:387 length:291 start_codon:yes stop_codon:yes gene_type:complete
MAFKMRSNPMRRNFPSAFKDYVKTGASPSGWVRVNEDHKSSKPKTWENRNGLTFPIEYHSHGLTRGEMRGGSESKVKRKSQDAKHKSKGIGSNQPK